MKLICLGVLVLFFCSCDNFLDKKIHEINADETQTFITNDTIAPIRKMVNPSPIASFSQKVDDEINDWKFAVNILETKQTFQYLMKVQYKELRVTDTLHIPNFGTQPRVEIIKGKANLECIIGFRDKKEIFKEYKLVSANGDKLKIMKLKSYFIGVYSNKTTL